MRNHQQADPEGATIAKLGDATFKRKDETDVPWFDDDDLLWRETKTLIRYGATFWKPIEPEPGYRLVEDHERVGLMPKGCLVHCTGGTWGSSYGKFWDENLTYAVPIQQVVAWIAEYAPPRSYSAHFATKELRDRAVEKANRGEL